MADESALHGVDDVLAYIDKTVSNCDISGSTEWSWSKAEVLEVLKDIRAGLTSAPEWSQVVESNLRAELAEARADVAGRDEWIVAESLAGRTPWDYEQRIARLVAERDEARNCTRAVKRSRRFWINKCRDLRGERNRARSLAVLLEQALAVVEVGHE